MRCEAIVKRQYKDQLHDPPQCPNKAKWRLHFRRTSPILVCPNHLARYQGTDLIRSEFLSLAMRTL